MCSKIRYDKLNVLWGKQTPPNNHLLCLADEMIEARTVCPPPQVASERQSSLTACLACHWLTVEKFSWPRIFCTLHSARGHCSHLPTIILFSRQASKDTLLGGSKTNGFPHELGAPPDHSRKCLGAGTRAPHERPHELTFVSFFLLAQKANNILRDLSQC